MADWQGIEAEVEAMLGEAGYELVRFQVQAQRGARLELLVDRRDEPGTITLDECADLSRRVGAYLDAADPFAGRYRLVVSSPGVDRPLHRLEHCSQFAGRQVRMRCRSGQRTATVTGRLLGVEGDQVVLEVGDEQRRVSWSEVIQANLVYEWGD